jgi:hypothetical protein
MDNEKLYVVVRSDLPAGAMLAQSAHAAVAFGFRHPELAAEWFWDSNNLVILETPDEASLRALVTNARVARIPYVLFSEPDFDMAATAAAFGKEAKKMLRGLSLALRERPTSSSGSRAPRASPVVGA